MIRKIKLYISLAAVVLSSTACLDKYPENAILQGDAIKTVEDVDQAVIGIYAGFKTTALYSGYLTLLPDIQTDLVYAVQGYTNVYGNIWRNEILATNPEIEDVYGTLYTIIGRCNFILDNVDQVEAGTTDDTKLERLENYKGEVYFARALAYSELLKCFCKAYESDEQAANELGLVLKSSYVNPQPLKRASLKDSYQFVMNDLEKATEYLALDEDDNTTLYNAGYFLSVLLTLFMLVCICICGNGIKLLNTLVK